MKNEAYDFGYNMAAGKAAYENEVFMKCIAFFVVIGILFFLVCYINCKIDEYKEKKREEKRKKNKSKKRIKKNDEIR